MIQGLLCVQVCQGSKEAGGESSMFSRDPAVLGLGFRALLQFLARHPSRRMRRAVLCSERGRHIWKLQHSTVSFTAELVSRQFRPTVHLMGLIFAPILRTDLLAPWPFKCVWPITPRGERPCMSHVQNSVQGGCIGVVYGTWDPYERAWSP